MKAFLKFLAIGLVGSFSFGAFNARGDLEVAASVQINAKADFYAPLTPQGTWVEVRSYGRCWRPAGVSVEWRPYCSGSWVWTDCGWYWSSDEPWAWACYHYGYWAYESDYGWVWVPDVVWGPAWVSWRMGGGYVGWAPLPPPGVSIHVATPSLFVFVETGHFTQPIRPTKVIVNNTTIIKQTTVINNIKQVNRTVDGAAPQKVVVNEGPGVGFVEKQTNRKMDVVRIQDAAQRTAAPSTMERRPTPERQLAPTDKLPPAETPGPPAKKSSPPDQPRQTPGHEFAPAPAPAPGPGTSPGNPAGPPDGRGKGPEKDKDKGHDKDRP